MRYTQSPPVGQVAGVGLKCFVEAIDLKSTTMQTRATLGFFPLVKISGKKALI